MRNGLLLPLLASILFLAMISVNALANILPLNGLNTGEVSDLYPSLFTPSGITFSIWSVIYLLLTGTVIAIWTNRSDMVIRKVLPIFCLSCIFNSAWIMAWHYLLPGISVVIMLCLLTVLIITFKILVSAKNLSNKMRIWLRLPFTLYLAWITVATIANVAAFLVSLDWHGGFLSEESWTVVMVIAATLLALIVTVKFNSPFYSMVVIWAILGIYLRWRGSDYMYIIYSSIICIALMVINLLYAVRRGGAPNTR